MLEPLCAMYSGQLIKTYIIINTMFTYYNQYFQFAKFKIYITIKCNMRLSINVFIMLNYTEFMNGANEILIELVTENLNFRNFFVITPHVTNLFISYFIYHIIYLTYYNIK